MRSAAVMWEGATRHVLPVFVRCPRRSHLAAVPAVGQQDGQHMAPRPHQRADVVGLVLNPSAVLRVARGEFDVADAPPVEERLVQAQGRGDPQPLRLNRVDVLGPAVDGPYLDAGNSCEMRGVQASDTAAADDRDADRAGVTGHDAARAVRAMSAQIDGSPPPTPRPATTHPASRAGSPPGTPSTGGATSAATASAWPNREPRSPLSQSKSAAAPATACATATPPVGAPSIRSC